MAFKGIDVNVHYVKDPKLNKKHVQEVMDFCKIDPNIPDLDEPLTILFLQKVKHDKEAAKKAIDAYFKHKRTNSKMYHGRNPLDLKEHLDHILFVTLPKTPEGYTVLFTKAVHSDCQHDVYTVLKYLDMVLILDMIQEGTSPGFVFVVDINTYSYDFVKQLLIPSVLNILFENLEKNVPVEFKGIHYINPNAHTKELTDAVKLAMHNPNLMFVHDTLDDFAKFVPKACLPKDYGGSAESVAELHEKVKRKMLENADYFDWEDKQLMGNTN